MRLSIRVGRRHKAAGVTDVLPDLFLLRGVAAHILSDSGPEFVARAVQGWIPAVGARTASIAPGNPWEHDNVQAIDPRLRDELPDDAIFHSLR